VSVKVAAGPAHDCKAGGHVIALRLAWDLDSVKVTPFCESCRLVFLPSASMSGPHAAWLMERIEEARNAPEAPPEAYEGMFE
jgi:hypothetical protein